MAPTYNGDTVTLLRQKSLVPTLVQPTLDNSIKGGQNFSGYLYRRSEKDFPYPLLYSEALMEVPQGYSKGARG